MTGAETAVGHMDGKTAGFCDTTEHSTDPAPVSPLRERMRKRVAYWKTLRTLSDEQEAALEFWEDYLRRDRMTLAAERRPQQDVSEPLQRR